MKRFFLAAVAVMLLTGANAQRATATGPQLTWENSNHNFGEVVLGSKVEHIYKFTNTGTEPLIITNVVVSCGCTLPKSWPRDPVMPGDTGELIIAFDSSAKPLGKLERTTQVVSNATNEGANMIKFSAMIIEKKVAN
jgi:hypothetical protein